MQRSAVLFLCALVLCTVAPAASIGARARLGTPVEKVVNLLKELKEKITLDGRSEQQVYDKYACWCEKTTARKAESITEAQEELRQLGQTMLTLKGQVATLTSEIAELGEGIRQNEKAQAQLTTIRQKQNAAFQAETAEMKSVIATLEQAILVLREGSKQESFLQQGLRMSSAVRNVVSTMPATLAVKHEQLAMLQEFASMEEGQEAKYAPQSWTVQGILRDMYDTFARDLEGATSTEATQNRQYEDMMHEKVKQLKRLQAQKADKEEKKANAEALLAQTTQNYDDTKEQMEADISFFDETKAACKSKHDEWEIRKNLRADELDGVSKALNVLSTDDARQLFADSIKAGKEVRADTSYDIGVEPAALLQVGSDSSTDAMAPVRGAYASLSNTARRVHSVRLAALAVQVREAKVGHFGKVLSMIDTVVTQLKEENAADIAKRDQCLEEYKKTDGSIANVKWLIRKNSAKIDKLENLIEKLNHEKAMTIQEILDTEAQMRALRKQRQDENAAFLDAKQKDQDAVKLLSTAKTVLLKYYGKNRIELGPIQGGVKDLELAQQGPDFEVSADQAPDAVFSGKGKRKLESKGIAQIMTMLIEDLSDEIRNGMKAEEDAQLLFEKQYAAAADLRAKLIRKKDNLADAISQRTQDRDDEVQDKKDNNADLKDESDYRKKITPDCDWIIGAFEQRAQQRVAEMEGLNGAKDFLAGFKPSALLQEKHPMGDATLANIRFLGVSP